MDGRMVNDSNADGHGETLQRTQQRSCMNDDNRSGKLSPGDFFHFRRDGGDPGRIRTSGAVFGNNALAKESGISGKSEGVKVAVKDNGRRILLKNASSPTVRGPRASRAT